MKYIVDFFSKNIFLKDIRLVTNRQEFFDYDGPKINYSGSMISDREFLVTNMGLLYESIIKKQAINCFESQGHKAFFQTSSGDFPFDIFAATFYLISRYEEYLPHEKDKYGRYAHRNSLAFKESFLHLPLINFWLLDFKKALLQKYPGMGLRKQQFTFVPTYDIDIAWSYRNKGWWRSAGGFLKSFVRAEWRAVKERVQVILEKQKDPFDSYEWLDSIHKDKQLQPIYFFLLALTQKGFDKNISPLKSELQTLVKHHASLYHTGIHPSWQSVDNDNILKWEIKHLEFLTGCKITRSRQHYLRFSLPETYQKLIKLGICEEYSMGYGTANGFRASIASPYNWYDLQNELATGLVIYPFCFMDANAYYEQKLSPAQAFAELISMYKIIKEVNGTMITLWHNNFLGSDPAFTGWGEAYKKFLDEVVV